MTTLAPGHHTHAEILSQPEAWTSALAALHAQTAVLLAFYQDGAFETVLFTGCGSTYYLAHAAAALMAEAGGIEARALPASEIWLHPRLAYRAERRTLLVAVSRSGETTETIRAVEGFKASGGAAVLTLTCTPGKALAGLGALNLLLTSGQEESIAQTRAFTTLYLGAAFLSGVFGQNNALLDSLSQLPAACRRLLEAYAGLARELGRDAGLERFYFLGAGPRYGLAAELSLKMKEMSLSHSEPFHFLEFRHGPQSMANAQTLIVGLVSDAQAAHERKVLDEMRARGAKILALGESEGDVLLQSGVGEAARGALYLPVGQLIAFERALSKGLNPDKPQNLTAFVTLA